MRVLVLFNEPLLAESAPHFESEHGVLDTAGAVGSCLARAGFSVDTLALGRDPAPLVDALRADPPAIVFNLFEGFVDDPGSEHRVARVLEGHGVAFTGSPSRALRRARDKPGAKERLRRGGVPVPGGVVVHRLPVEPRPVAWPVLVKPARHDASEGICTESVVCTPAALDARLATVLAAYGAPAMVEEFVPGREFQVALVALPRLRALPASEFVFLGSGPGAWPVATYDAKWRPGSPDYLATEPRYPADVAPGLAALLRARARRAFRLLGCRDYARVDLRLSAAGDPLVLEVNPNPDLSPTACMAGALASAGITHEAFLVGLARTALARRGHPRSSRSRPRPRRQVV